MTSGVVIRFGAIGRGAVSDSSRAKDKTKREQRVVAPQLATYTLTSAMSHAIELLDRR